MSHDDGCAEIPTLQWWRLQHCGCRPAWSGSTRLLGACGSLREKPAGPSLRMSQLLEALIHWDRPSERTSRDSTVSENSGLAEECRNNAGYQFQTTVASSSTWQAVLKSPYFSRPSLMNLMKFPKEQLAPGPSWHWGIGRGALLAIIRTYSVPARAPLDRSQVIISMPICPRKGMSSAIFHARAKFTRSVGKASLTSEEELKRPRAVAKNGGTSRWVKLTKNRCPSSSGTNVRFEESKDFGSIWNLENRSAVVFSQGKPRNGDNGLPGPT